LAKAQGLSAVQTIRSLPDNRPENPFGMAMIDFSYVAAVGFLHKISAAFSR
jgi:hypothetical protein